MSTRVERVELLNFKSYAGHVVIAPFKDFTCIVGPNGSGKSNLMDAMTFVLSADNNTSIMRTKSATDLINRNIKDKAAECSVTIVLSHDSPKKGNVNIDDNSNNVSNEISTHQERIETSLTRRVNCNGHLSVLVNDKEVSEREFAQTLSNLHISSRVSTFIVFQHAVEKVAQMRSRELTGLLEQVSGSAELEQEYNALKAAMINANETLTQASVEKRGATQAVTQMRMAQKELEHYTQLRKRCQAAKREMALTELLYIEVELHKQKVELDKFQCKLRKLEEHIHSEQEVRRLKQEYAMKHKTYVESLRKNRKLADQLRGVYGSRDRVKAALDHLRRKYDIQHQEVESLTISDNARQREVERLRKLKAQQEFMLEQFDASCHREDVEVGTLETVLNETQLATYRELRNDADGQTVTLRQQIDSLRRQRTSVEEVMKQFVQQQERLEAEHNSLQNDIARTSAHQTTLSTRRAEIEQSLVDFNTRIRETQDEIASFTSRAAERNAELNKLNEQLHELRFVKDSDKQQGKITQAMERLRSLFPIRGRLVDVCSVPNTRYRNAVTVAMGKYLEALVVDSTAVAMKCVQFLKQRRLPPMTFLPLDTVRGNEVDDSHRRLHGTCKPLIDVITVSDEAVYPAVRFAIGQTLVCDSLAEAREVAYGQEHTRNKVVTLDGTLLLKNGSVQGGLAAIQSRSRKWDEQKYENLRVARDKLLQEADESVGHGAMSESVIQRKQIELREWESKVSFGHNRLRVINVEAEQQATKLTNMQSEANKLTATMSSLTERVREYEDKLRSLDDALLQLSKQVAQVEGRVFASFQRTVQINNLLQLETRQMELTQQRARKRQEFMILIHKLDAAIETETKQMGGLSASDGREVLTRLQQEITNHEDKLQSFETQLNELNCEYNGSKQTIAALRSELDGVERQIYQLSRSTETELNRLAHARKGAAGLQAACETLRLRRGALIQRCQMDGIELPLCDWSEQAMLLLRQNNNNNNNEDRKTDKEVDADAEEEEQREQQHRRMTSDTNKPATTDIIYSEPFTLFITSRVNKATGTHGPETNSASHNLHNATRDDSNNSRNNSNNDINTNFGKGNKKTSNSTITSSTSSNSSDTNSVQHEQKVYIDFTELTSILRDVANTRTTLDEHKQRTDALIQSLTHELEQLAPILKVASHYAHSENQLGTSTSVLEQARERARAAHSAFAAIKETRVRRFMSAFDKIQSSVNHIYQELTLGTRANAIHGIAYLTLEDTDEPYLAGTTYHATPPMKRFMPMDALSGGEKTMAALALLFAIHAVSPTPLFILDEVDAALDAVNVEKLANYLRHSCANCQYVIVSLKDELYHLADVLIGVMKDKDLQSSRVLTMDLRNYPLEL